MDKHIKLLTELLKWWWEYKGDATWDKLLENNKRSAIIIFIYDKLKEK